MFTEGKRGIAIYYLSIGRLFSYEALGGLRSDSRNMLIDFGIVSVVAVVSGFSYFVFYALRNM